MIISTKKMKKIVHFLFSFFSFCIKMTTRILICTQLFLVLWGEQERKV